MNPWFSDVFGRHPGRTLNDLPRLMNERFGEPVDPALEARRYDVMKTREQQLATMLRAEYEPLEYRQWRIVECLRGVLEQRVNHAVISQNTHLQTSKDAFTDINAYVNVTPKRAYIQKLWNDVSGYQRTLTIEGDPGFVVTQYPARTIHLLNLFQFFFNDGATIHTLYGSADMTVAEVLIMTTKRGWTLPEGLGGGIVFQGQHLDNDSTLAFYGIVRDSTVHRYNSYIYMRWPLKFRVVGDPLRENHVYEITVPRYVTVTKAIQLIRETYPRMNVRGLILGLNGQVITQGTRGTLRDGYGIDSFIQVALA